MKKLILVAVILIFAWSYYKKESVHLKPIVVNQPDPIGQSTHSDRRAVLKNETQQTDQQAVSRSEAEFKCDGREYCGQMNSRAEAEFFVKNCPNTKMDGDRDGIPCENDTRF